MISILFLSLFAHRAAAVRLEPPDTTMNAPVVDDAIAPRRTLAARP